MDDFWKKIYEVLMTPLPPPPNYSPQVDKLFEYLRSVETPTIGELPKAPEWLLEYARERAGQTQDNSIQRPPESPLYEALGGNRAQGLSR